MSAPQSPSIDDTTAIELWGRAIRGYQVTSKKLHSSIHEQFDLNEAEAETLLTLHLHPEHRAPLNALSKATAFTTGGFTKIADKLVARDLAVRVACSTDRRVTYLELTDEGIKLASKLATFVAEANRANFIELLGPERAQIVADAMTELYRAHH